MLWDPLRGLLIREWVAHVGGVDCLAFSPDSRFLASSGKDNAVTIWTVDDDVRCVTVLKEVQKMWRVHLCGWCGDNVLFTSQTKSMAVLRVWDTQTSTQRQLLSARSILGVPFHRVFRFISTSDDNPAVRVWQVDREMMVHTLGLVGYNGDSRCSLPDSAAYSFGGGLLASAHGPDEVLVWNLEIDASQPRATLRHTVGDLKGIAISQENNRVVCWGGQESVVCDRREGFKARPLIGHTHHIHMACFSPDGEYVASASGDGTVHIWLASSQSIRATFRDNASSTPRFHTRSIILFAPDGETILHADMDGFVFIHRLSDATSVDREF